ncbi:unnamed protein product [Didymodactylos carnosus]|uniref:Dynein heavy chain ATP-binding dynein motor region domain-containing protein n=1 Tax=Didymodactylos carnosus TaxID=1234261 RepID=A0A8S2GSV8_9BILA|nr:unnamed protein product [Didymodactylos carnosus]CAF3554008.1 unnamed protein product [Didymodactylos carnosus]
MAHSKKELQRKSSHLLKIDEEYTTITEPSSCREPKLKNIFLIELNVSCIFQEETDIAERRRTAANQLMTGFRSETVRWRQELNNMKNRENQLLGNCLLGAGFLAYLGPFTFEIREELLHNQWEVHLLEKNIPLSQPYRVQNFLSSDVEISEYQSYGLPSDEFSVQNGILTIQASRFPYCIDPQMQGLRWIKAMESKSNLKILSMRDRDFLKHIELAIKYGYPVLFKDNDEYIDPIILNILSKNIQDNQKNLFVKLGDKEIDIDPNFRMYLTSRLPNPKLSTFHFGRSIVINYTVTLKGLEEQLLSVLVKIERRELEEMRVNH